jgi:hypothetical protein
VECPCGAVDLEFRWSKTDSSVQICKPCYNKQVSVRGAFTCTSMRSIINLLIIEQC